MTVKYWLKKEIKQEGQLAVMASVVIASIGMTATTLVFYFTQSQTQNEKIATVQTDIAVIKSTMVTKDDFNNFLKNKMLPISKQN